MPKIQSPITYTSTDGGVSWVSHIPPKLGSPKAASALRVGTCSDDGMSCVALGDYNSGYINGQYITSFVSYVSIDGGVTWATHNIGNHTGQSYITDVTCNKGGKHCIAIGTIDAAKEALSQPIVYISEDGGTNWISKSLPHDEAGGALQKIACYKDDNQDCIIVGSYLSVTGLEGHDRYNPHPIAYATTDGGNSWMRNSAGNGVAFGSFESVSCDSQGQYCTIIGYTRDIQSKHINALITESVNFGKEWMPGHLVKANEIEKSIETVGIDIGGAIN